MRDVDREQTKERKRQREMLIADVMIMKKK